MNAKKAKALRRLIPDWRDKSYRRLNSHSRRKPIVLNPVCGRAKYKAAKRSAA